MSNATCYRCSSLIQPSDQSEEHIIQSALGGRLKSRRLLHKSCNNDFGNTIDAELAKALNVFMVIFNISRADGESPPSHKTETTQGTPVTLAANGRIQLTRPEKPKTEKISDSEVRINLVAPNMEIARQQLEGLSRKYPKLDVDKMLSETQSKLTPQPEVKLQMNVGTSDHLRAITKIAVGFYLHSGGSIAAVAKAIEYIKTALGGPYVFPMYGHPVLETLSDDLIHYLEVVANETGVHAYIQLFSVVRFYVHLSTEPASPLCASYTFDCISASDLERKSSFAMELENGLDFQTIEMSDNVFYRECERILTLRGRRDQATAIERICELAVRVVFEKYKALGREPTAIEVSREIPKVMEDVILQWARNAHDARSKIDKADFLQKIKGSL